MGVPPVIIHLFSDFPWNKPSSYWDTSIHGNPQIAIIGHLETPTVCVTSETFGKTPPRISKTLSSTKPETELLALSHEILVDVD